MIRVAPGNIENPQQITAVVAGPDQANRLFVLDGQLNVSLWSSNQVPAKETFSVLLGPVLTRRQFVQASGSAAITGLNTSGGGGAGGWIWLVASVDADWDDESGQVELRVEVSLTPGAGSIVQLSKLGYHVTILAEV
ncbi:MAG TPA: hypothetical protein VKG01_03285 [Thermoanaerobaculia bacterium]|nr:hypothetical protein [Thermoanaerobaculia bacterium]